MMNSNRQIEWMDRPDQPPSDIAHSLRDLRRVNRYLSGTTATLTHLRRMILERSQTRPIMVLDMAAGSGDIPQAAVKWARRNGIALNYLALDVNPSVIEEARRREGGFPEINFIQGDARAVPFRDHSFHIVTCSMALHHFDPREAITILREMSRLSRWGLIVNDLRRSRIAWFSIFLLTRILRANRLTRHDGPLSTLQAYTPVELHSMARNAGLTHYSVVRHRFYRMALVCEKE